MSPPKGRILVLGATGFVGESLVPALVASGRLVRACARHVPPAKTGTNLEYVRCDVLNARELASALGGVEAAYYLVHSLGQAQTFRELDRRAALAFASAAENAGLRRVIYLGGVAPRHHASEHLASRLEVGHILRAGGVPTLELRASMIVGVGSASWQIVRDLALRLPAMVLPAWLGSRMSPIAKDDVVRALIDALDVPLASSAYYDIPGPSTLSGKQILEHIAALEGRQVPTLSLSWLTPTLSALWLRLVTRADFALARQLVLGLTEDLLAANGDYWELTKHPPSLSFDAAARAALDDERRRGTASHWFGRLEEGLVRQIGRRLHDAHQSS